MQIQNVGLKTLEHLTGGLAGDAAVDVVVVGKILVQAPEIRDGIAEEDDARLGRIRSGNSAVRFGVARNVRGIGIDQAGVQRLRERAKVRIETRKIVAQLGELSSAASGNGKGLGRASASARYARKFASSV